MRDKTFVFGSIAKRSDVYRELLPIKRELTQHFKKIY